MLARLTVILLVSPTVSEANSGWRGDGTGVHLEAAPPADRDRSTTCWRTETQQRGNASPVLFADMVCITEEPATLSCFDRETGALRWSRTHELYDDLSKREQPAAQDALAAASDAERELPLLQSALSAIRRSRRAAPDDDGLKAAEDDNRARIAHLQEVLKGTEWLRTPDNQELIGWATSTPVVHNGSITVLFGHGILASYDVAGATRWRRWLGPPPGQMRGYELGTASSLVAHQNTLIVGFRELQGLSLDDGTTTWQAGPWTDFGTPTLVEMDSVVGLATPDGRLLDPVEGTIWAQDLWEVWFVGPWSDGKQIIAIGGRAADHTVAAGGAWATAYTVSVEKDRLKASPSWRTKLSTRDIFYTGPVADTSFIYSVTRSGELRVLNRTDGKVVHEADLLPSLRGWAYGSPTLTATGLHLSGSGAWMTLTTGATPRVLATGTHLDASEHRATPLFVGKRRYVRSGRHLTCLEAP